MRICEYGCEREAKFLFKNGKWCCENFSGRCPKVRERNSRSNIGKILSEDHKKKCRLAFLGKSHSKESKEKISKANSGVPKSEEHKKKLSESRIGITPKKSRPPIQINTDELCYYGCGEKAKYKFNNGKVCCSKTYSGCQINKDNVSNQFKGKPSHKKGKKDSYETRKKKSEFQKRRFSKKENLEKQSEILKEIWSRPEEQVKRKRSIDDINRRYPLFSKIEKLRYNPDKLGEKEIQCKCKQCKEWFTLTTIDLNNRIASIEKPFGFGECHLYCSKECKQKCSIYRVRPSNILNQNNSDKYYTYEEKQIFNKEVLKRADGLCEYCGQPAEHVHHIRPQKLEPFFSLDPDYGVSCCSKCHYKYGHETGTECSTGNLASEVCNG